MHPTTIASILLLLLLALVAHELGHVLGARFFGIEVAEVGIGLPPRLGAVSWRGFQLSLNWIPLGAFVRYHERTSTPDASSLAELPAWQRLVVALAGPFANLVIASVVLACEAALGTALPREAVWLGFAFAFLSLAIAATNLIPIPPLDGGKILFLIIETMRGRRLVSQPVQARIDRAGLAVLATAFAACLVFDIVRGL